MGLKINADLETSSGPTTSVYLRVEGYRYSKLSNELQFTTSAWVSKEESDNFRKIYADDEPGHALGILSPIMTVYVDDDSEGIDISIENFYKFVPKYKEVVEIPIFEDKEVTEEIPYVSFDSEGEEITLYRTKVKTEKVQIGTDKVEKVVLDRKAGETPLQFCYDELKARLSAMIPSALIEKI
jgi:hypothetical protein